MRGLIKLVILCVMMGAVLVLLSEYQEPTLPYIILTKSIALALLFGGSKAIKTIDDHAEY